MIKWMASPLTDPNSMLSLLVLVLLENWYILKMNNYCQECYRGNEYVSKFQLSICHISWQYLWHVTLSRAAPASHIPAQSCITFHHQWKFKYSNGNDTSFCIGVMVSWDLGWSVELETNLCEVSQCPKKATTRAFSLLKEPTHACTLNA